MTKSMLFQIVYSNLQTPNTQTFSECKILKAWVTKLIFTTDLRTAPWDLYIPKIQCSIRNTITNSYKTLHN